MSTVSIARRWPTTSSLSGRRDGRKSRSRTTHRRRSTRRQSPSWKIDARSRRASARPTMRISRFRRCPSDLVDAVLIQPAHAAAAFHAPGHGPRLEDPRRRELGSRPGRHRVWLRPGPGAGLDLEDIRRDRVDCHSRRPTAKRCQKPSHRPAAPRRPRDLFGS